jgi:PPM family protein phosphatase
MVVTCPACGGESHDLEFCDHCNADLAPRPVSAAPLRCPLRPDNDLTPEQQSALSRPENAAFLSTADALWRVHWVPWAAWDTWRPFVEERQRYSIWPLPRCRIVEDATGVWVAAERSSRRFEPWTEFYWHDGIHELRRLAGGLESLGQALEELHAHGLVWLNFDPREIEETFAVSDRGVGEPSRVSGQSGEPSRVSGRGENGAAASSVSVQLRFTNLDLQVFAAGQCPEKLEASPLFTPPEVARMQAADIGPRTSVFQLALYGYYWLAQLLPRGFAGRGLETFGFQFPNLRVFAPRLPPGIAGVLGRGLAIDPVERFASCGALVEAFRAAVDRAERRANATAPVHWQIGVHSRTGRTKSAQGRGNEDYAMVRQFSAPDRALVAVADGITTCHVGSGALASWMAALVLEQTVDHTGTQEGFPRLMRAACRKAAGLLLSWALEKGYRPQLAEGRDLMGTTLTAGWLQGNRFTLANLGDSRAYLIDGDRIEQLTVDGDLGSELLATGTPPEEVRELGGLARALRVCIGGCSKNAAGELTILEEYCRPVMSFWQLLPGDVLVVCSDGLVEEGAFLEPERLAELVRTRTDLSVEDLALLLAEEADSLHRVPSELEPDGFGDNITCIVIRISQ